MQSLNQQLEGFYRELVTSYGAMRRPREFTFQAVVDYIKRKQIQKQQVQQG